MDNFLNTVSEVYKKFGLKNTSVSLSFVCQSRVSSFLPFVATQMNNSLFISNK